MQQIPQREEENEKGRARGRGREREREREGGKEGARWWGQLKMKEVFLFVETISHICRN
jgi:hypothetical protein